MAVYFARHGVLITWPVAELAELMLRGGDHTEARAEFVALAERRRDEDYARRLRWRAGNSDGAGMPKSPA